MIESKLNENDHLIFQLYLASKSKRILRQRILMTILVPIIWIVFLFIQKERLENSFVTSFIVISIIWFVFYPIRSHFYYRKHYLRHIREYYDVDKDKTNNINIVDDQIVSKTDSTEIKININEIEKIVEINYYYFIFISKGSAIILRNDSSENLNIFINTLKNSGLKYIDEKKWKWI